jgi:YHS domain-containing protein
VPSECFVLVGLCRVLTKEFRAELESHLHEAVARTATDDIESERAIEAGAWALFMPTVASAAAFAFSLLRRAEAIRDLHARMKMAAHVAPSGFDRSALRPDSRPMKDALELLRAAPAGHVLVSQRFAARAAEIAFARTTPFRVARARGGKLITAHRISPVATVTRNMRSRIDPTCGAPLDPRQAVARLTVGDETMYFCSAECMVTFRSLARSARATTAAASALLLRKRY